MRLTDMISLASMAIVLAGLAFAGGALPTSNDELFYSHDLPEQPMNAHDSGPDGPSIVGRTEPADEF